MWSRVSQSSPAVTVSLPAARVCQRSVRESCNFIIDLLVRQRWRLQDFIVHERPKSWHAFGARH
jgi:hypothetical protein